MTDVAEIARGLTKAQARCLLAMTQQWQTVSEMRPSGATGSGCDLLFVRHSGKFCARRWTRWGADAGQRSGAGYEYIITPLGLAVRAILTKDATND